MKYLVMRDLMARLYYQSRLSGYEDGRGSLSFFSAIRETQDGRGECREILHMTDHIEHGETPVNVLLQQNGGDPGNGRGFQEYATGLGRQYGR